MAYQYIEFDSVPLPLYDQRQDDDTATAESALYNSIGGVVDYYGATARLPRRYQLTATGIYVGETTYLTDEAGNRLVDEAGNYLIAGNAVNRLRAQLQALRSKIGVRGSLVRVRQDDDAREWITARLLQVRHPKRQEEMARLATVTCLFESAHVAWRAETQTTHSVQTADGALCAWNVYNAGEGTVYDAVITLSCNANTITRVDIDGTGIELVWLGSLPYLSTLTIDCGAQTVRVGSTDSYSGFGAGSGHTARGWLPLAPGLTPLTLLTTGGNASATIAYYRQYP